MTKELTEAELDEIAENLDTFDGMGFHYPGHSRVMRSLIVEVRRLRGLLGQMREPLGLISEATPEQILLHTLDRIVDHRETHKAKVEMFLELDHQRKRAEAWREAAEALTGEFLPTAMIGDEAKLVALLEAARALEGGE